MNFWIFTIGLIFCTHLLHAAPKSKGKAHLALEQAMLHKLHKPWFKPDKPSSQPRKGEKPCPGGICKVQADSGCRRCQEAIPLDVNWEPIKRY